MYKKEQTSYIEELCGCAETCDNFCLNRNSQRECGRKCKSKCTNRELQTQPFVNYDKYFYLKKFEKKGLGLMARIDLDDVSLFFN